MLAQFAVDAGGRIDAFLDAYGVPGVGVLLVLAVSIIAIQFVKGTGLSLLLLISSYSLIFVESSGVSTAAFFVRTLALITLVLSLARRFVVPGWAFYGMFLYEPSFAWTWMSWSSAPSECLERAAPAKLS